MTRFPDTAALIKTGLWPNVREHVAAHVLATESEQLERAENTRTNALGQMSELQFYERMQQSIATRKQRDEVAKSVVAHVMSLALGQREGSSKTLALWVESLTKTESNRELSAVDAFKRARAEILDKSGVQFSAAQTDALRTYSLQQFEQSRAVANRYSGVAERAFRAFASELGADGGRFGDDVASIDDVIDELTDYSDNEREVIMSMILLYAQNAPETKDAREEKGALQKTGELNYRQTRDVLAAHAESFKQYGLTDRLRVAQRLEELTSVDEAGRRTLNVVQETKLHPFSNVSVGKMHPVLSFLKSSEAQKYGIESVDDISRFIAQTKRDEKRYAVALQMKALAEGEIDPARFESDFWTGVASFPAQGAFMAQAMFPIAGLALIANATKGLRTQELILSGMSLQKAETIAAISAVPEAMIERVQVGMFRGKSASGKLLDNLVTKPTPWTLAKRAAVVGTAEFLLQGAQELVQDASPLAMRYLASRISEEYGAPVAEEWKALGASIPETAGVLLPLVLIGTGQGALKDRKFANTVLGYTDGLRAMGFREETVTQVLDLARQGKMKDAEALVEKAYPEVARRRLWAEKEQQMNRLEDKLKGEGESIAQHNITLTDKGGFEVRNSKGELVDTVADADEALELARWVYQDEQAKRAEAEQREFEEQQRRDELRKERELEIAGFEAENERKQAEREQAAEESRQQASREDNEEMRKRYPEEAARADANPRDVSLTELGELKQRRERAIEMLERRSRAVEATGGNHKSVREYEVAFAQAERLDSEYAVAWFNYARRRQEIFAAARAEVPVLQERMSNPFLGQRRTTLPDSTRKGAWTEERVVQQTISAQQEQQSQEAINNAEGDVGPKTAQGLSKQASTTLENTQNRGVLGDVISSEVAKKIQEVIDSADNSKELPHKKATIGPVSARVVDIIRATLGIDVSGYQHSIDTNAVKHIFRGHGQENAKREREREQIPITAEDIQNIPLVLTFPDDVKHTGKTGRGIEGITYWKRMSDGMVIYVEEVHSQNGELATKTLYKKEYPAENHAIANNRDPSSYVQDDSGDTGDVSQQSADVKPLGSPLSLDRPNAARVSFEGEAAEAGSALAKRKKPVSMPEVMTALAKVIETVGGKAKGMFRRGHLGSKNALGQYDPYSQVTRVDSHDNMRTAAHELAHAIDAALWGHYTHWQENTLELSDAARAELAQLGKDLYKNGEPHNGYHSEGFAEFMRLWLTDSEQAKQKAPEFTKWFESEVLDKSPRMAKVMAEAQALAHRFLRQGASARGDASIAQTPTTAQKAGRLTREQMSNFYKNWIEMSAAIEKFAEEAARIRGDEGGVLPEEIDPFLSLMAARMTVDAIVKDMAEKGMQNFAGDRTDVKPLMDAFKLAGKRQHRDFMVYLLAKRTVALLNDPRGPRKTPLDRADAEWLVEKYERESPQFIHAAQIVYDWNSAILDYAAQASPALAETVRRIREVDPGFYIPLQREFSEMEQRYRPTGGSSAARAELTKRLKGSSRRVKDILESMLVQAKNIVLKAHQRHIIDQIMHIAQTTPGLGWAVVKVDATALTPEQLKQMEALQGRDVGSQEGNELLEEFTAFFAPAYDPTANEPRIFPVWENGKVRYYELDGELYDALAGMDRAKMSKAVQLFFGIPATTMRLGTTGLRASFALTNAIRDFSTLWRQTRANGNSGQLLMDWLGTAKDSFLYAVTNGKVDNAWLDVARRLGIEMAQSLSQDSQPLVLMARRIANGGEWSPFSAGDWYDLFKNVVQSTETATRVTELKGMAKDRGWDPSMPLTRELSNVFMRGMKQSSTDFTQAGVYARKMNQIVPFFNAGIQGPVASWRALKRNPKRFLTRSMMLTAFVLANWFRNRDEDWWKEMSMSERYRYTYIPLPNGDLLRIPRAFEVDGLFMAGAEALVDAWYAEDPHAVAEWFGEWMLSFKPDVLPVPVKWGVETLANYDLFRKRSIEPKGMQYRPSSERFGPYTSSVAIKLAEVFDIKGVSPYRIDHAIRSFFGGVGTDLVGLLGRGNSNLIDREWEAADTPVLGVLFQRGGQRAGRPESVDSLYRAYDKALDKQNSIRHEETPAERQQRLMLADATTAIGLYRDISLITKGKEARLELEKEQIQIAREVVGLVKEGRVDRSVTNRHLGEARAKTYRKVNELNITPNGKNRPIRDAISR